MTRPSRSTRPVWLALGEGHREALVHHELLHLGTHEKTGELLIVDHDVAEFTTVVREYGAWVPSLRLGGATWPWA